MFERCVVATLLACSLTLNCGEVFSMSVVQHKSAQSEIPKPTKSIKSVKSTKSGTPPLVEQYLLNGNLPEGEAALKSHLSVHPSDVQARFGLGVLQFLIAIQNASQQINHYGVRNIAESIPPRFISFNLPNNPQPHSISYQQFRKIIQDFNAKVAEAEETLSHVTSSDVTLPLHFGSIKMDFTGLKTNTLEQTDRQHLWQLYSQVSGNIHITTAEAESFYIKFDRGDVHWLRGYCHVFLAVTNVVLAYDFQNSFESSAQLFFARVDSPHKILSERRRPDRALRFGQEVNDIVDLIAGLHNLRCEVVEPDRMKAALHDLEEVVAQSRESWRWIMAETDDDHEWLPNPRQTGVIPGMQVTDEMVRAWMEIMDENEKILQGKLLIPYWRGADTTVGINLRQVFLVPRKFDLIEWIQGVGPEPYLEKGELSRGDNWTRMRQAFPNNFPGFVLYFN